MSDIPHNDPRMKILFAIIIFVIIDHFVFDGVSLNWVMDHLLWLANSFANFVS